MSEGTGYVYGREAVVRLIVESQATAIVVTGDSGVGKSTVLSGVQRVSDGLAPPPVRVGAGPGALDRALAAAVTLALAAHVEDVGQISLVRQRMLAASRTFERGAKDRVRAGLVDLLLDQVRMRLGDTAAEVVADMRSAWNDSEQDSLQRRLAAFTVTDTSAALAEVASDLANVADEDVSLALDDAHLLTDEDLRRLRDLVADPADRVHLRVAYTTVGAGLDEPLVRLAEAGALRVVVDGLDEDSVRFWLTREGIPASLTPAVMSATLGYALHVGDAIQLLREFDAAPGTLMGLSQAEVVLRGSERAWSALSDEDRQAVLVLLPFAHRPSALRISELLQVEALRWSVLRQRLRESGVFVDREDDSWFHELRRQALWQELDNDTQVAVATRALQCILSLSRVSYEEVGVAASLLGSASLDVAVQDSSARVITRLSNNAVAVAAAVMDLAGLAEDEAFVNTTGALLRAHERYAAPADCLAAMRELHESEVVYLASNEHASVVAPRWSLAGAVLIAARTLRQTGRVPFQGVGRLIVEVLRPRLGSFRIASATVGPFDAAQQSRIAVEMQRRGPDGEYRFGRAPDRSLLLALNLDGTEIASTVAYEDVDARDRAFGRMVDAEERVLGGILKTILCRRHPLPVVPSRRFVLAAESILGERLNNRYSSDLRSERSVSASVDARAEQRAETLEAVRALCSQEELLAYDLLQPTGIAWAAHEEEHRGTRSFSSEFATVTGIVGAHRMADRERSPEERPYDFMYLTQRAGLQPGQRVNHVVRQGSITPGRSLVFLEQLEALVKEAADYNAQQVREILSSDLSAVEARVSEAQARRGRDAVELATRVSGLPTYEGQAVRGVLGIVSPLRDEFAGDFPQFTIATVELDGPIGAGT